MNGLFIDKVVTAAGCVAVVEHVHGAALPGQDRPQAGQLLPRQGDHQPHRTLH